MRQKKQVSVPDQSGKNAKPAKAGKSGKPAKTRKTAKVGKPNPLLYFGGCLAIAPIYRIKYGLKIDRSGLKDLKGPAIVLCQHLSNKDHVVAALTLFPKRPTFVASRHFLMNPTLRWVFRVMHIITKKMFCADMTAVRNILRAKQENNVIVMFPEGRLPANGLSVPVAEGTAELVKKMGIDVYLLRGEGAYKTFPKWGLARKGRISVKTEKLLDAETIGTMSAEEIDGLLQKAFAYNDETALTETRFRTKDTTIGLDALLWKCPSCGGEWTIPAKNSKISCSCGYGTTLDERFCFSSGKFRTVSEWYRWQQKELLREREYLECRATLGVPDEKGNLNPHAGEATIRIDRQNFSLKGELLGEPLEILTPVSRLGGFPVTVGQHIDVYRNGELIYLYPMPDSRQAIQWVAFLDGLRMPALAERGES